MAYKIYTDKNENFECEVSVKNASLKGARARLVVESQEGPNLVFNGKIENGKCIVPISRLKGFLEENSRGNIYLEMIVEDTYFQPWKSDFIVEEHTSVKVTVNESKISNKPMVNVKVAADKPKHDDIRVPLYEIIQLCKRFGITRKTIRSQAGAMKQVVYEYFNNNPEFITCKSRVIENLKYFLV